MDYELSDWLMISFGYYVKHTNTRDLRLPKWIWPFSPDRPGPGAGWTTCRAAS